MIQHPAFVFLHFPKTAGMKIDAVFRDYLLDVPGLAMDPIDTTGRPRWHDSIQDRGVILRGHTVVTGFRRLPAWLVSRVSFETQRSGIPWDRALLQGAQFLEADGETIGHADLYARHWLPEELLGAHRVQFIRSEHFAADFRRVFGQWLPVERVPPAVLEARSNTSDRDGELVRAVYDGQEQIYGACPHWRALESIAYGA